MHFPCLILSSDKGSFKDIIKGVVMYPSASSNWKYLLIRNAKSLVKHLVVADLSKRYGNLKRGVNDIKKHRWFKI